MQPGRGTCRQPGGSFTCRAVSLLLYSSLASPNLKKMSSNRRLLLLAKTRLYDCIIAICHTVTHHYALIHPTLGGGLLGCVYEIQD
jgi:hypothetical protein